MHLEDLDRINGLFFSLRTRLNKIEADISHADQMGIEVSVYKLKLFFNQMPIECTIRSVFFLIVVEDNPTNYNFC